MQPIAPEYENAELKVRPGDRLHRVVALMFDTYYDDLTDLIPELERMIEGRRWMNAAGKRLDQ